MSAGPPPLPVVFRPARTRAVLIGAGVALFVVLTVIAVALPEMGAGERAGFVLTGLLCLGVLLLLSRPKLVADRSGVTVVNLTRTRRMEWPQILRVNLRPGDPWVYLDLSDGTTVSVMGIQPGIAKDRAVGQARALRALVEEYGSGTPAA